jgi:hypothetical protein
MSTSGVYKEATSTQQIVRQAMLNIACLDPDENPTNSEYDDVRRLLNMMVSQWMGKADFAPGLKVWTRKRGYVFLNSSGYQYSLSAFNTSGWTNSFTKLHLTGSVGVGTNVITLNGTVAIGQFIGVVCSDGSLFWSTIATISPSITTTANFTVSALSGANAYVYTTPAQYPVNVEAAVLRDDQNSDTPLRIMLQGTYDALSNKVDPQNMGDPTAIYVEENLGFTYIYTDVGAAQDVTKYIVLTYLEPVQKFINPTDEPEYPEEWYMPLHFALSKIIAPMFKKRWTDTLESNLMMSLAIARNKSGEKTPLYFQCGENE